MPLVETLPVGLDTAQWSAWSTTVRLVVTDPAALGPAREIVTGELAAVDLACSRFRDDAEIAAVHRAGGRPVPVSPLLAELVEVALAAARDTGGDVDPTLGSVLYALGYDRDYADLSSAPAVHSPAPAVHSPAPAVHSPAQAVHSPAQAVHSPAQAVHSPAPVVASLSVTAPGWRGVRLRGYELTVPAGTVLDLGATAKAWTADRCAALISARLGVGVLVGIGGDIATAGPAPDGDWQILVSDGPDQPAATVGLPAGAALATSSTISRTWQAGERRLHHILDPRTLAPARTVWRTVSVAAHTCLRANTLSTAAVVRGLAAVAWLRRLGAPARLVTAAGQVRLVGDWPAAPAGGGQP